MLKRLKELYYKLVSLKGIIFIGATLLFLFTDKIPIAYYVGIIGFVVTDRTVEKAIGRIAQHKKELDNNNISLGR